VRVRILYFAAVRDLVARDEESLELPADVKRVEEFSRWIGSHHAALAGRMGSVRIARNEVFARSDESLAEGDVLALIPPVAGGA
jgi:molybdopterin converting factor subunit 1